LEILYCKRYFNFIVLIDKRWVLDAMFDGQQSPKRFTHLLSIEDIQSMPSELGEVIKNSKHDSEWPLNFVSVGYLYIFVLGPF
jgi:hypothetical protein